jgi:hypothetical protein
MHDVGTYTIETEYLRVFSFQVTSSGVNPLLVNNVRLIWARPIIYSN